MTLRKLKQVNKLSRGKINLRVIRLEGKRWDYVESQVRRKLDLEFYQWLRECKLLLAQLEFQLSTDV